MDLSGRDPDKPRKQDPYADFSAFDTGTVTFGGKGKSPIGQLDFSLLFGNRQHLKGIKR